LNPREWLPPIILERAMTDLNLPERRNWSREFLSDAFHLKINDAIEILDQDNVAPVNGRVANIQQTPTGEWRVGVQIESYHLPGVYENSPNHSIADCRNSR
jgi:hypothetical protein